MGAEAAALDCYATVDQFRLRAPQAQAFSNTQDAVIVAAIERRSRWLDGYLKSKFVLPLVSWQSDLTGAIIDTTAYDLMIGRGFNPDSPTDVQLRMRYEDAEKWAKSIPLATTPLVVDSSSGATPGENNLTPNVTSATQRGFSSRPTQATFPPNVGDWTGD